MSRQLATLLPVVATLLLVWTGFNAYTHHVDEYVQQLAYRSMRCAVHGAQSHVYVCVMTTEFNELYGQARYLGQRTTGSSERRPN